jgi:microcystin-dependent protein
VGLDAFEQLRGTPPTIQRDPFTGVVTKADETGIWVAALGDDHRVPVGPCRGDQDIVAGATVLVVWTQERPWAITADPAAAGGPGGAAGPAGGVLAGTYPDPTFAQDMATQAELEAGLAEKAPLEHDHAIVDVTGLQAALDGKQGTSEKGQANGYASLDGAGKVPWAQLPSAIMSYEGVWNASTNTPALSDGTSNYDAGAVFKVTVAGTRTFGTGNTLTFAVGDYAIYNGTKWEKSDATDDVVSVAGKTGAVSLVKGDVGLGNVDNTSDANKPVSTAQQTALDLKAPLASPTFTGDPKAPTPATTDSDTSIATTAFVKAVLLASHPVGDIVINVTGANPSTYIGGTWVAWGSGRVPVGVDTAQAEFNVAEETGGEKTHVLTAAEMPSHTHTINHDHPATTTSSDSHSHSISSPMTVTKSNVESTSTGTTDNGGHSVNAGFTSGRFNSLLDVTGTTTSDAHTHTLDVPALAGSSGSAGSDTGHNNLQPYITCFMWKRTA